MRKVPNLTLRREDGRVVAESVVVADSTGRRLRGLLGKKDLPSGHGVLLRPAWSIHTAFMRFPIDVVFLDADQIVIKIVPNLSPFHTASCRGAREVVELRAGECERRGLALGDRVAWAARAADEAAPVAVTNLEGERRGAVVLAQQRPALPQARPVPPRREGDRRRRERATAARRGGRRRRIRGRRRDRRRRGNGGAPARQRHARAATRGDGRPRRRGRRRARAGRHARSTRSGTTRKVSSPPSRTRSGARRSCRLGGSCRGRLRKGETRGRHEMSSRIGDAADPLTPKRAGSTLLASTSPTTPIETVPSEGRSLRAPAAADVPARLESAHRELLAETDSRIHPFLKAAHRSGIVAFEGGGRSDAADRLAVGVYVAAVVVSLAAEGNLDAARREGRGPGARRGARRAARGGPLRPPSHGLHEPAPDRAASARRVRDPIAAAGPARRRGAKSRSGARTTEPSSRVLAFGEGAASRRARATAKGALRRGGSLSLLGGRTLRSALVRRFSSPCAAIVARVPGRVAQADAYLQTTGARARPRLRAGAPARALRRPRAHPRRARASSDSCGSASTSTTARSRTCSRSAPRCRSSATRSTRSFSTATASGPQDASTTSWPASRSSTGSSVSSHVRSSRAASSPARSARSSIARSTPSRSARASRRGSRSAATRSR